MKNRSKIHYFIIGFCPFSSLQSYSQSYVSDQIFMGPGYAHEIFYSLSNDSVGSSLIKNWDLAFSVYGGTSNEFLSILANHVNGVTIYFNGTTASQNQFDNFDTTGFQGWLKLYNTDTSWWYGAFNLEPYAHPNYSWATYGTSGTMIGRYIYLIELSTTGQATVYKKLWIKRKSSISGTVEIEFSYANLDGTDLQNVTLSNLQTTYAGKRYVFYSLRNHQPFDREPARNSWDLTFTRYITFINQGGGSPTPYTVTGLLSNQNVQVSRVSGVPVMDAQEGSVPYSLSMNAIGYDWKFFNNSTFQWMIQDSLSYFIKDVNGAIWHLFFTEFGGQSNGMTKFSKKLISPASVQESQGPHSVMVYPNPASQYLFLVSDFPWPEEGMIELIDLSGRQLYSYRLSIKSGFQSNNIDLRSVQEGVYMLRIKGHRVDWVQKLIVSAQ